MNPGIGGTGFATPPMAKRLQELCPQISFQGYQTLYNDTGLFGIIFTLFNTGNTAAVIDEIVNELQRIAFDLTEGNKV